MFGEKGEVRMKWIVIVAVKSAGYSVDVSAVKSDSPWLWADTARRTVASTNKTSTDCHLSTPRSRGPREKKHQISLAMVANSIPLASCKYIHDNIVIDRRCLRRRLTFAWTAPIQLKATRRRPSTCSSPFQRDARSPLYSNDASRATLSTSGREADYSSLR